MLNMLLTVVIAGAHVFVHVPALISLASRYASRLPGQPRTDHTNIYHSHPSLLPERRSQKLSGKMDL